tara:strand:+ start:376 stop:768 length:393 start_codon:yes stop_codon:yes gene_type:complete
MEKINVNETSNINALIDERATIKAQMDGLNKRLKEFRAALDQVDILLLKKLDDEGLNRTANGIASVSINEDTVPDVSDWDALYKHVIATEDFSLIQRRVSSTAYRELLKMGEAVPGLQPRTVRRINFRSL